MECSGGEELSDSSSSGYWSWDHGMGSPAPSPSVTEAIDATLAPSADEGIDIDMEQDLCTGPVTRKHKNPVRLAYRCLWPSCGKVLTSVVGMKRHIRILHLGHSSESEQSQREEDFYYTEIHRRLASRPPSVPPSAHCASPPNPSMEIQPGTPPPSLLSQSAPDSYCQVQSEQLYQACPPVQVAVSPSSPCWSPPVTVLQSTQAGPFRSRSVSVGEQWAPQHSASLRPHPVSRSPPHTHCASSHVEVKRGLWVGMGLGWGWGRSYTSFWREKSADRLLYLLEWLAMPRYCFRNSLKRFWLFHLRADLRMPMKPPKPPKRFERLNPASSFSAPSASSCSSSSCSSSSSPSMSSAPSSSLTLSCWPPYEGPTGPICLCGASWSLLRARVAWWNRCRASENRSLPSFSRLTGSVTSSPSSSSPCFRTSPPTGREVNCGFSAACRHSSHADLPTKQRDKQVEKRAVSRSPSTLDAQLIKAMLCKTIIASQHAP
ncbi:hypothetical protein JZ751_010437 [Albula glossodonta]|uniref:C2H2-type domain-containing protein n=1 Tax=Albula glossodonta TaxID=121402 RepID=A0A8T2NZ80_9TELE|nr:hypothetical protein JZ751_010437 [Albula glossodonta]